ncbi:MAG: Fur family transcriptional regulator [Planctomycetota bacterium]
MVEADDSPLNHLTSGMAESLRAHGVRATPQREAIYDALIHSKNHPSADELFHAVQARLPGLSLATVYNTLETLVDAGLCRKVPAGYVTRYDADTSDHVHVQLEDGRVVDVPGDLSRRMLEGIPPATLAAIGRSLGIDITGLRVELTARQARPAETQPGTNAHASA